MDDAIWNSYQLHVNGFQHSDCDVPLLSLQCLMHTNLFEMTHDQTSCFIVFIMPSLAPHIKDNSGSYCTTTVPDFCLNHCLLQL